MHFHLLITLGPVFGVMDWNLKDNIERVVRGSPLLMMDGIVKKYGSVVKITMGMQHAILLGGENNFQPAACFPLI